MSFLVASIIVSGTIAAIEKNNADKAEREAEERNATFLEKQAQNAEINALRSEEIFRKDSDQIIGAIQGGVQNSGFDFSGSDYELLTESLRNQTKVIDDIRTEGKRQVELIRMQRAGAEERMSSISAASKWNTASSLLGTATKVGAAIKSNKANGVD